MVMTMDEIREIATAVGIQSVNKFKNKGDLVQTIQLEEGNQDCYGQIPDCDLKTCRWREDCMEQEQN